MDYKKITSTEIAAFDHDEAKGFQVALACFRINNDKRIATAQQALQAVGILIHDKPLPLKKFAANTLYGTILS